MKEALINFINLRIDWHKCEHLRLRKEDRVDEAAHLQIAINVYNIFLSTYRALNFELAATLTRFSSIVDTWDKSHQLAHEHDDIEKKLIEEIKISRALEIIQHAKELEMMHHD